MNIRKKCVACREPLPVRPQCKNHRYCRKADCQRQRKNQWQRSKRLKDKAYQQNEKDSGRTWRARHPNYWREYREKNPAYAQRNRLKQQARNKWRGKPKPKQEKIVEQSAAAPDQENIVIEIAGKTFQLTEITETPFKRRRPPPREQVGADCKQGRVDRLTYSKCGR